jgi:hypothetical protein
VRPLVWVAVSVGALVALAFGAVWVWGRFLAWWAAADGFNHFNVWMLLAGVVVATIARACGLSWGWTIALAVALPLVVVGAVLRAGVRNADAWSRTFDDG